MTRSDDWLLNQLPAALAAEDFFARFVRIFQAQGSTLLSHADNVPHLADPDVAPVELVRWMTQWLGSPGLDPSYPEEMHRAMLRTSAATLQWRGTRRGLVSLLELITGGQVRLTESGGVWPQDEAPGGAPWVRIEIDDVGLIGEDDLVEMVLDEVPAHVRVEFIVGGRAVWPVAAASLEGASR